MDFYANVSGGGTDIRRREDGQPGPYYKEAKLTVGTLFEPTWPVLPLLEGGFGWTGGETRVAGSGRLQGFVNTGLRFDHLWKFDGWSLGGFATGKVGLGINHTEFTFGAGTREPPKDWNASFIVSGQVGAQACFEGWPCVEAFWAPFYEIGEAGEDHFDDRSLTFFGVGVRFGTRLVDYEEYKRVRQVLTVAEGQVADLKGQVAILEQNRPPCPEPPIPPPCPEPPPPAERATTAIDILNQNPIAGTFIPFANESAKLPKVTERVHGVPQGRIIAQLGAVVRYLKDHPDRGIIIHGYANDVGPERYNKRLSRKRAWVVQRYLIQRGIEKLRIKHFGHGSAGPPLSAIPADIRNRVVTLEEVSYP